MFFFKGNLIYPMQFPSDFLDSIKRLRPDDFDSLIGSLNTEAVTSVRLHPSNQSLGNDCNNRRSVGVTLRILSFVITKSVNCL